jgi:hypothetical protein
MTKKFSKPPLSPLEKEKKAEEFLNFYDSSEKKQQQKTSEPVIRYLKKEPVAAFTLRLPKSIVEDLEEISALTGLTRNSICLELLRVNAKTKLRELKNEDKINY